MEYFEFSSDALYPSLNNDLIIQPLETTNSLSAQPTEEITRSQAETNLTYNSTEIVTENIARTQQTVPHPVTSVTSSNLNDWVSHSDSVSSSVYNEQGMTDTSTSYSPSYNGIRQQSQFPENMTTTTTYSPVTQPVAFWAQQYPESQSIPRNTNIRLARSRQQNPYFRGRVPTSTLHQARPLAEGTAISRYQQQTDFNSPANSLASNPGQMLLPETQQHQENFAFVNSIPENHMIRAQLQSGQETPVMTVNHSVGVTMGDGNASQNLTNLTPQQSQVQTQSGSSVIPETSGIDSRSTLPVQQILRQLVETIKSPNCTAEQQYQAVQILRSDPRLMAAFLQMKQRSVSQHGNPSNISNMTTNQQQSTAAYRTTMPMLPNMTEHMKFPFMMTGGSVRVSSSAVPRYNSYAVGAMQNQDNGQQHNISSHSEMNSSNGYAGYPTHAETGRLATSSWSNNQPSSSSSTYLSLEVTSAGQDVNNKGSLSGMGNSASEPGVTAILQLAAARQLIVQASASAAAAGAKSLSQTLNDRTLSLDRVMSAHCPSFLHGGRTQMKALLSLTSSANSQLSAPRIPTCSICLDKLVSTILLPCRHFFCETCAPKIEKCGLCRELIENRHRVYF